LIPDITQRIRFSKTDTVKQNDTGGHVARLLYMWGATCLFYLGLEGAILAKILLEMKNITKTFPGVKALDNVNLKVEEGEIHALVGENGAGKSTLMNVLSGVYGYGTYEGDIVYDGEVCKFHDIKNSEEKGIVIIHQELALIPYMSIGENMFLGNERGKKAAINWDETYGMAEKYMKQVGLSESARTLVKDIGVGKQQLVEIAKALAKNAKLLILDEPTSSLNESDSRALLDLLLSFKKEGMTCIIITHKLNEVSYVADKITVIRDGSTIETLVKGVDDLSEDRIIKGMVGREIADRFPKRKDSKIGDVNMEVKNWTVYHPLYTERKVVDHVSIKVHKGEVVGISGLMGAGRTELAKSVFGRSYGTNISGTLLLNGKEVHLKNAKDAIRHKLAYVTEDRKGDGLILGNPIKVNTTLANLEAISSHSVIDKDKEYAVAVEYKEKLKTKCPTVEQNVGNLSGGNQQKVLLAKWMFADPDVLILDEPTRGIDVGAKYEIYCIINDLVAAGKSVIMISSELPEILGMSDRIYVMNEGRIAGELKREEATQEKIMSCILKSSSKGE
jgi:putative multiple sugar transport system ATP-binding protein